MKRLSARSVWLSLVFMTVTVGAVFALDVFTRGWLSLLWYFGAALVSLLIGGPIACGLIPKNYSGERPIRSVGSGMGQ